VSAYVTASNTIPVEQWSPSIKGRWLKPGGPRIKTPEQRRQEKIERRRLARQNPEQRERMRQNELARLERMSEEKKAELAERRYEAYLKRTEAERMAAQARKQERRSAREARVALIMAEKESKIQEKKKAMQQRRKQDGMITCSQCNQSKPFEDYFKVNGRAIARCKPCHYSRKREKLDADPELRKAAREAVQRWKKANPERAREQARRAVAKWQQNHPERAKEIRRGVRKRESADPINRIKRSLRKRMSDLLKGKQCRDKYLGCNRGQLRSHLQAQFKRRMTWENYGTHWHVDHIIPLAAFNLQDEQQRRIACNWQNLRPLEATRNIAKVYRGGCGVAVGVAPLVEQLSFQYA